MKETRFTSHAIGKLWEENAPMWIHLVTKGYDYYRDHVNTPGFFSILPNINGKLGLDIGCGEGHNTRLLAKQGSKMTGLDISPTFISYCAKKEKENPLGINFVEGDAISLPFKDEIFDFATAFVSFIDIPEYKQAFKEAYRILKKNSFFQLSITHPCFWTTDLEWVLDEKNKKRGLVCKDYFSGEEGSIEEWIFDGVDENILEYKKRFRSPIFRRTLSQWMDAVLEAGFIIEKFYEPRPSCDAIKKYPDICGSAIVPFFLIIRCKKI